MNKYGSKFKRNTPGAGEGQSAGVPQVDQTTCQICHGGLCWGAGSQSLQFESRVHTARSRRETSHLPLQLPTDRHHITPPGGTQGKLHRQIKSLVSFIKLVFEVFFESEVSSNYIFTSQNESRHCLFTINVQVTVGKM